MTKTKRPLPPGLTWPGALYCLWATVAIGLSLMVGGFKPENNTRLMVLLFLALSLLARGPLLKAISRFQPRTRFVGLGCALASVVEGFHMISEPVFKSLRVTAETPWSQALLNFGLDLLFTLPAYALIFSLIWFLINRYAYSFWGYVVIMGLAQALGDGGLYFFWAAPGMLAFLPYPMTNYHTINLLPFLSVQDQLQPTRTKGGWVAIPAIIATYFACGALIQILGKFFGL
ncbi:MAG: hypothetical protein AB7I41_07070 [Candidatus Sericytochromatia bacterium]